MIKLKKIRFIPVLLILLLVGMMIAPTISMAAEPTVNLGTTSSFAVLAGSTVTNTGSTTIDGDAGGDVGVSTGSAITGFPPGIVTGAMHSNDASAIQAQTDLVTAYNDAAGRSTTQDLTGTDLGTLTLTPGVYTFSTSAQLTGDLMLDGQGLSDPVFIFKIGSTLTTASNSRILLKNGARYCRTFWQVGSSATLGSSSTFVGHIFAMASITANNGATVQGQLLARNGAVTLDTNTITNGYCSTPPAPPVPATLHIIKHVINDDGGTAVASAFTLHVKAGGIDVAGSPAAGGESPGTTYTLPAGTYVVNEATPVGYTKAYSGDSDSSGNITLAAGADKTVTITNNDISPAVPANLHIIKHVINDDGGTAVASAFTLHLKFGGIDVAGSPAAGVESPGTTYTLPAGTYVVSENPLAGYIAVYSGNSDPAGNIILTAGADSTVTVTNNDIPTPPIISSGGGSSYVISPLINVIKTPSPLALPSGAGLVTYTYKVTNPGLVALSNVSVTDDKVSPVTYVSGDVNADNLLQPSETWIYTVQMNLSATTTNTATAKGSANGMTATDIALATVIVTTGVVVYPPLINVTKIPAPLALTTGPGLVTYTYKVTNPGLVALSNIGITDDKVSPVTYVSGDVNDDSLLQPDETWIYTSQMNLNASTTNTATAKGSANGLTAVDIAFATVVVTPLKPPTPKLPKTGSETNVPWLFPIGVFAIGLLLITFPVIKRRISSPKR